MLLLARLLVPAEAAVEQDAPLRWVAESPSCPQAPQIREAVVELAGRWPRRDELQVEAFLQPQEQHWQLTLTLVLGEKVHRQELEAESCSALARAAALIIAVSIDPVASASVARVSIPLEAVPPRVVEEAEPTPPAEEPRPMPAPPPRRAVPFVGGGWAVSTGMTPGPSSGPTLAVGLSLDHSRLELMGRYVLRRTATDSNGRAPIQAGVVAARACLTSGPGNVRGLLCAGLEAGALRADGRGFSNPRTRHFPLFAGLVRGGIRWRFSPRWAVAADVEGSVSAVDAEVRAGDSTLFETPRIGVRGLLGVEIAIPRP